MFIGWITPALLIPVSKPPMSVAAPVVDLYPVQDTETPSKFVKAVGNVTDSLIEVVPGPSICPQPY